jgi:hypothetical protein
MTYQRQVAVHDYVPGEFGRCAVAGCEMPPKNRRHLVTCPGDTCPTRCGRCGCCSHSRDECCTCHVPACVCG